MWHIPTGVINHYEGTWLSDLSIDSRTDAKLHPRRRWLGSRWFESFVRADNVTETSSFSFMVQVNNIVFKWSSDVLNNAILI